MSDVDRWLEEQGLSEYAQVILDNNMRVGDQPDLTEDDVRELGLPIGACRRLLTALEAVAMSTLEPESARPSGSSGAEQWARRPEPRRPVTLLFVDVTGSTTLTQQLDTEDAHALLYEAVRRMGQTVEKHNGTVCRFMGDGLMAMFGVPVAFESHPRAACMRLRTIDSPCDS